MKITPINNTNYLKHGDTASKVELLITDFGGSYVDLTKYANIKVFIANEKETLREIEPTIEADLGKLSFDFSQVHLLESGTYRLEVRLETENGDYRTAPSRKYLSLHITE